MTVWIYNIQHLTCLAVCVMCGMGLVDQMTLAGWLTCFAPLLLQVNMFNFLSVLSDWLLERDLLPQPLLICCHRAEVRHSLG